MPESLLGHLALRFTSSPENLATEALVFILNRSQVANETLSNFLGHLNILLPPRLTYEAQDNGADNAIPDLVGKDSNGNKLLLGEAKFWAGLTGNQPVTYLQRLKQGNGKVLLFLAPAQRIPTLWPELQRRCNDCDFHLTGIPTEISEVCAAKAGEEQYLVLISWRKLLGAIRQSLETEREYEMVSNITQLEGLCERMDETAFLPLKSEELTSYTSRRLMQYIDLIDHITDTLVSEGIISIKGLKATGTRIAYIRYFNTLNFSPHRSCSLEFNISLWSKYRDTPLWLGVNGAGWIFSPEIKQQLTSLELAEPSRLLQVGETFYVPVYLETGVERDVVVKGILEQIRKVFSLLQ